MLNAVSPRHNIAWTRIATLAEYRTAYGLIDNAARARRCSSAVYELFVFARQQPTIARGALRGAQNAFLMGNRFAANPGSSLAHIWAGALVDAVRSAHTRASVYRPGTRSAERQPFLSDLRARLTDMGQAYVREISPLTVTQFEADIQALVHDMRACYPAIL
jgi:hypothetical protein